MLVEVSLTRIPFQSTPSAWRETPVLGKFALSNRHFNPLPPHGGRPHFGFKISSNLIFQSTPSAWRETAAHWNEATEEIFQSTPSAWRETDLIRVIRHTGRISIHSLRMEGDRSCYGNRASGNGFQSTPSAWRETLFPVRNFDRRFYFNPLPPHGGRPVI